MSNQADAQSLDYLPDASLAWTAISPTPLPPLVFQGLSGKPLTVDSFKGHVLLVNLWATWCGPCKAELPTFEALAPKLEDFSGKILPICTDESGLSAAKAYFKAQNIRNLPVLADPSGEDLNLLQAQGIPVTIVVRPDGKAVAELEGAADWNTQGTLDFLRNLAGQAADSSGGYS